MKNSFFKKFANYFTIMVAIFNVFSGILVGGIQVYGYASTEVNTVSRPSLNTDDIRSIILYKGTENPKQKIAQAGCDPSTQSCGDDDGQSLIPPGCNPATESCDTGPGGRSGSGGGSGCDPRTQSCGDDDGQSLIPAGCDPRTQSCGDGSGSGSGGSSGSGSGGSSGSGSGGSSGSGSGGTGGSGGGGQPPCDPTDMSCADGTGQDIRDEREGGGEGGGGMLENPFKGGVATLSGLLSLIVNDIIIPIGAVLAAFFIIYSGYLYVIARGDTTKLTDAKKTLTGALIGTIILLGAWTIAKVFQGTICSIVGDIEACSGDNLLE